ncbi:MAG: AbrB/MazE/SpoVT family DNA-binding domain-containing protein [Candidatus Bathyarchaeota archaeon]|nr:AbrB/MazE/SpoVT family DNA-binding domain-containing protein [Candidatus Bathyarchaeota archaeon]
MSKQLKVLQNGKITIPADIRKELGISDGDYITLRIVDGRIMLLPSKTVPNPTDLLTGLAKGVQVTEPAKQELRKTAARRIKKKTAINQG